MDFMVNIDMCTLYDDKVRGGGYRSICPSR